ncbi:hypothetical protein J3R30DRAFT_918966 [Lentinula aciculospora]|uniref:Uncharacterized protein n=1 Tax=Lentinula aciculospora TaxID=153920 RepID=A0A9W9DX49_9AGAR|nr:hypothetical protein J3R30DRAFT_918966 [Lentinula aciculospora]
MASGPPANARVNSSRTTRITAARPPEINSGQRICNGTAEQIRARPSPALIRQTSVTQSTASTRNLPHTSLPLARRPAQSNAPAGTSRSTYNSLIDLQSVSRLPSASTPVQSLSTRSSTLASPSRIARPRAVSAASPTTPIGLPSRVRTMSSINPPTKYHLGSPVTSTKILNTNSVSGVVPKSSTSPTSSPRPAPKSRPATSPIVKSRATLAPSIPLKRSTRRDAAVSGRELKSEAGAESKIQSAKSIQNTESKNADPNAPEVTDSANLSSEDVDMLESVWKGMYTILIPRSV